VEVAEFLYILQIIRLHLKLLVGSKFYDDDDHFHDESKDFYYFQQHYGDALNLLDSFY